MAKKRKRKIKFAISSDLPILGKKYNLQVINYTFEGIIFNSIRTEKIRKITNLYDIDVIKTDNYIYIVRKIISNQKIVTVVKWGFIKNKPILYEELLISCFCAKLNRVDSYDFISKKCESIKKHKNFYYCTFEDGSEWFLLRENMRF
jgi:hypothetical protein